MSQGISGFKGKKDVARRRASRTRAALVSKEIARHIVRSGLGVGDKLPTQIELCQKMGLCQDTVHLAMRHLVEIGLIVRRTYHGSEIVDLEGLNRLTWTIGIAAIDFPIHGPGGASAWLLHALLSEVAHRNCTCHTYFRGGRLHWPQHAFGEFAGLAEDVADHAIDGLITLEEMDARSLAACSRAGIPILNCGYIKSSMPLSVLNDYRGMVADSIPVLLGRGARRLALVASEGVKVEDFADLARLSAGVLGGNALTTEYVNASPSMEAGAQVAAMFEERAANERPDGLIFLDDFTALGAAHALVAMPGYAPHLVVFSNKQLPQIWPKPVLRYELDIAEVAACAMKMLQQVLLNPTLPPWQERVPIRRANGAGG